MDGAPTARCGAITARIVDSVSRQCSVTPVCGCSTAIDDRRVLKLDRPSFLIIVYRAVEGVAVMVNQRYRRY